jgi:hypothetical protein
MKPSVGRIVHYVSHEMPGGSPVCRAAVVTAVNEDSGTLNLTVFETTNTLAGVGALYDEGKETPGDGNCLNADTHGAPFRYCACGWVEATQKGGSWHWPERES